MSLATMRTGRIATSKAQSIGSSAFSSRASRRRGLCVRATTDAAEPDAAVIDKNLELMRHFSEQYAQRTGTYFCVDKSVTAVVIQGLAEHKASLGAPLCPCRHYDDKAAEAANGFWNCPCVPMRERKECHCMLFLTEDNDFAGREQEITHEEVIDGIKHMM
ncbi:Ferredoxin thioredoxin reductase, beta subunit [Monoraphidium neglectum]|uniref:Ferredoxin-thioredoxin reductase catalytic chain, chloroplastic n=1 Tax=Monoraphidium neglectum TaxID=145388 RepID=A0A0D2LM07_9CHLO|nr:Ferredoxin thioredoxin reductase, beta subunit [Monoraphidium neglectum]KIZ07389.1 Ferredoxin thioredoxin reductase, beta subunit [Monoraphidium neglectum]|eukprot:XP_013906408.1 Ferredoxin thioredoxin reductase, beta subunit [Monoraphidium neglectum]